VRPTVQLGVGEPPARLHRGPEPVAGGPRTRKKARGECPKCKSKGVVLARSYSGDEYYSCIYCGWQAYKAVDEDDPNASLAVRLLGQTAGTE
jgi:Zn ribbon nucleic-acid-binding protein